MNEDVLVPRGLLEDCLYALTTASKGGGHESLRAYLRNVLYPGELSESERQALALVEY